MFRNYIKIAWRNIWKSRKLSVINITGLAIAIAVSLLLCLTVYWEKSYDGFHKNGKDIYQVYLDEYQPQKTRTRSNLPLPTGPAIQAEIPGVKAMTRLRTGGAAMRVNDITQDASVRFVDSAFLQMFTFPAINGMPVLGLNNVILTRKTAQKFFKEEDPVGKTIHMKDGEIWKPFTITAVLEDVPGNSSLRFDLLARTEAQPRYEQIRDDWNSSSIQTFVQLTPGTAVEDVEKRGKAFLEKHFDGDVKQLKVEGAKPDKFGGVMHLGCIPMKEVHFSEISSLGKVKHSMLYLMLFVAGFLLFIASINFVNLTMAKAFTRAREVGMRKVLGAAKSQLTLQLCGEAFILFLFALILGLTLAYFILPQYNAMLSYKLNFALMGKPEVIIGTLLAFLLISLLAGGYPALLLARSRTLQILKGKVSTGKRNYLRNSLIVVQFTFSCLLIGCTLVAWQQMNYLRSKPLGYNTHEVISIPVGTEVNGHLLLERMRTQLAQQPDIVSVSGAGNNFGLGKDRSSSTSMMIFKHDQKQMSTHWLGIEFGYLKTMDLQLIAGRDLDKTLAGDSNAIVINEEMARQLAVKDIIGYRMRFDEDGPQYQVVGVVRNFHFKSLHRPIEPVTMYLNPQAGPPDYLFVRTAPGDLRAAMQAVEKAWKSAAPGAPFLGSFVDENTERLYENDRSLSQIFVSGAALTIIISCMGLFAIAMLAIGQRTKEIGIRKVLGASVVNITALISRDFLQLVGLAILIASPLAWWMMHRWLQDFAYHVHISWWVFAIAGLLAIMVAACTISFQSVRAALMNPVKSLRTE